MFRDRIVVRHIVFDEEPKVLHDCTVWDCRDMCDFYDEDMYHITGDYMLPGNIEILYIKVKCTRFQRFLMKILEYFFNFCVTPKPGSW